MVNAASEAASGCQNPPVHLGGGTGEEQGGANALLLVAELVLPWGARTVGDPVAKHQEIPSHRHNWEAAQKI